MSEFLLYYDPVEPTTWVYLSSLLMIGLFFKFSRFWSVRNLDIVLLILLAPGLLLVHFGHQLRTIDSRESVAVIEVSESASSESVRDDSPESELRLSETFVGEGILSRQEQGKRIEKWGYLTLLGIGILWLARLLLDSTMVRRPMLAPNLTAGGLTFIGTCLFLFLMANVVAPRRDADQPAVGSPMQRMRAARMDETLGITDQTGPGYAILNVLPSRVSKVVAVAAHLAIVLGMVFFGYRHFDDMTTGIAAATLYLMLPYTSQLTGLVDHVLPAALMIWTVLNYRRPILAGIFLGLAGGVVYYPLFLLPVWVSFYWKKGLGRFLVGFFLALAVLTISLAIFSSGNSLWSDLQRMFGLMRPAMRDLQGIWNLNIGGWEPVFRLPVLAAFVVLSGSLAIWPPQKNLGTLLGCSAAVMLASQFWHGFGGGLYMAWWVPLALLTVFRPNLEDRVAQNVLVDGWLPRRRTPLPASQRNT